MSFDLSNVVNPSKVFIERKANVIGRWDPFYFRPELVALEKRITAVTQCRLRDFVLSMAGGATPSTTEAETHYTERGDGIPFVRVQNLSTTGLLDLNDCKRITRGTHEGLLRRSRLSGGELLVKITGVGRMAVAAVVPDNFEGNINQHIVAIRTKDTKTSETLAAYLNLDIAERLASRRSTGGTRPALDYPALLSIPIIFDERIPNLMRIAVEKNRVQNRKAESLLATVDSVLLDELGIVRLPELPNKLEERIFRSRYSNITGNRWDPFRYSEKQVTRRNLVRHSLTNFRKLRHCVSNLNTGDWGEDVVDSFDENSLEQCLVIRNTEFDNAFNLRIENGREKYRLISKRKLKALDIRSMDILVEKSGGSIDQPVGRVAILRPEHLEVGPLGFSNFIVKIRAVENVVQPLFLYYWLRTAHRIGITESMQAQTSGLRNLILDEYFDQDVPIPDLTTQAKIVEKLELITEKARTYQEKARADFERAKRDIEALILGEETI